MQESKEKNHELEPSELISLMSIYLSEWQHRGNTLWAQVFRMYFANLIIIILPNISLYLGITLPEIDVKIFPIAGIVISFIFLYIGLGYAKRLEASGKTYKKIMDLLKNKDYERVPIEDVPYGKYFKASIANVLVVTLFLSLNFIAAVLLVIS